MKVTIGGETFDFDYTKRPMSEALAIEREWKRRYAEWESEVGAGSAEAIAVLAWLILRREGRDVPLADILDGKYDFDYFEMRRSLDEAVAEARAADEDPISGAETGSAPDGTDSTRSGTRHSSRRSSTSARGKSGSSPQPSSTT